MKKRISILILAVLAACASFAFVLSSAATEKNKPVVYKYALLGDTYTLESGLISAKTPTGEDISVNAEEVFLDWAQGSYIFEYGAKIVNLKVYESAPADEVVYGGEVPLGGATGEEMIFPSVKVFSGIKRTDGAPTIGEYGVSASVWHKGVKKETISVVTNGFSFTPTEKGFWVVSYRYTDVFGKERSIDHTVSVSSERIILTDIGSEYYVGEKINLANTYGFYNDEKHSVSAVLTLPSGETETISDEYVFPSSGNYKLALTSEIDGETVEKTIKIAVKTGLASFVADKNGFGDGTDFINHENVKNVSETGLMFDMTSSGASFKYNGVIDLKKLGKNTPVVSFTTNNSYGGSISMVDVTLTDVYDQKRAITVRFNKNSDITETSMSYDNTLVHASFGSVSTAFNNYYPMKTDAVAWDTRFSTYWLSPSYVNPDKNYDAAELLYPMNFAYDVEENCVYSYGDYKWVGRPDGNDSGEKWYKIADLQGSSLPVKFEGFTTGEVYLSLKVVSGRGDIVIQSLGGKSGVTDFDYETADSILTGAFDPTVPAVKGKAYVLPTYPNEYIKNLVVSVKNDNNEDVPVTNGSFIPEKAGNYTISYSGVNVFGKTVSKRFTLECTAATIATVIDYDVTGSVGFGSVYTIKEPEISGGHGEVSYKIYFCGEEAAAGERVIVNNENAEITVKTVDKLGFTAEKTFTLNVDKDAVKFTVDFPRAAEKGSSFTFPKATAKYFLTGENLAYDIYVDGVKSGETITLPTDKNSVEVEYRTAHGSKNFTLYLKSDGLLNGGDALLFDGTAKTTDEGTKISLLAGANTVKLPYKLSPNGMKIEFFVMADKLDFNAFSLLLTDENDTAIKLTLKDLKKDTPALYINGEDAGVNVIKRKQTFSSSASADYANKDYYAFTITYENAYKAALNGYQVMAYVTHDVRGIAFAGFTGGVYADLIVEETSGAAEFVLTNVSNQRFYSSSIEKGDKTGPALYSSKIRLGNSNVSVGYELDVSDIAAFDVLQKSATVSLMLTAPGGTKIYENVTPGAAGKVVLDKAGIYVLNVVATDAGGAKSTLNFRFVAEDKNPPKLTISGEIPSKVKKGQNVKLGKATAQDVSEVTVKITVIRPDGNLDILSEGKGEVAEISYKINSTGVYKVIYVAEDAYGNVGYKTYSITAEE